MDKEKLIESLIEFEDFESNLKKIFFSNCNQSITDPQSDSINKQLEEACKVLHFDPELFFKIQDTKVYLSEDICIAPDVNATVAKLSRYTPAFIHSHDFIEIIYVLEGHCTHASGEVTIEMEKGDLCLVAPNISHSISIFNDQGVVMNIMLRCSNFDTVFFDLLTENDILADFFNRIIYSGNKHSPYIFFRTGEDADLRDIFLNLIIEFNSGQKYKNRMMNIQLMLLFTVLLRNHEQDVSVIDPIAKKMDNQIVLMLRYIENNFNTVTFAHFAAFFNYSEEHMSRMIKGYTGRTFREILRDIKLKKAAELIINPSIPIKEIVEKIGYADISHFYKNFKNHFGLTPNAYRERAKLI
jgi:AraC-like DNA-binding protein/cupin superfamily acireductone dioxygenase involved in methionine salvage